MRAWISAARLRTLPLTLSSIVMGGFLAQGVFMFRKEVFFLAVLTTLLLQILSNFANDYGDTQNGADTAGRVGPQRAVQSGAITPKEMFRGIIFMGILAFVSGICLIYTAFGGFGSKYFWIFLGIGLLSILAAYMYTAGKRPYGYVGLGDISVFVFFGLVGVVGSYFLYTLQFDPKVLLPATACGALAAGVLNINNIRDINSDQKAGKITIPVLLGRKKAIVYHWILLLGAMGCAITFMSLRGGGTWYYWLSFPLLLLNGVQVSRNLNPDPYLKTLSLTSVAFVILFGLSIVL